MNTKTTDRKLREWLHERYPLALVLQWARQKRVPQHQYALWYSLGSMLLFMLGLQLITGIMLAFYYRPAEAEAYRSILNITGVMPFGWVIRSLHAWTSTALVAVTLAHLFSVWLLCAFRKPRELTWVSGVLLMGLLLGFGFSGYLLPWNELAFFATKVGTQIVGSIPVVGYRAMTFLRGGEEVTGGTLSRFFTLHICVLPLLTFALVGLHLLLVQIQGMSVPPSVEAKGEKYPEIPFFPDFFLHDLRVWAILFGILITLAVAFPVEIGRPADPLAPAPPGIRPEWYFLCIYQVLKLLPTQVLGIEGEVVGATLILCAWIVLLGLPFIFREKRSERRFSTCTAIALAALIFFMAFTLIGYLTSEMEKRQASPSLTLSQKPLDAQIEKSLAAGQTRIQSERPMFLLYTLGLWGCIGFLVLTINLRLAQARHERQLGLGGG